MLRLFIALAILASSSQVWVVDLAYAADPAHGERLAKRWCAECHVVAPDQTSARVDAPSFAAISATRRVPEISGFLQADHPQMPDMSLSRDEIANLIAWIQTLSPALDPIKPEPQSDTFKPPRGG